MWLVNARLAIYMCVHKQYDATLVVVLAMCVCVLRVGCVSHVSHAYKGRLHQITVQHENLTEKKLTNPHFISFDELNVDKTLQQYLIHSRT